MLHWFAGQKPPEGANDPDTTGFVEPPETPAPVFAVRAFKHAIFGTPQTTQTKARRHSNTENGRPKPVESKPSRPGMNRPKSTNDAHTLANQESQLIEEPLGSPTKGILLTPGGGAARKKNVTFGDNVVDNEEKRPMRSGLPEDCPGKFPSPWNNREESPDKSRGRNKLTEAFEQVRDESRKRKLKGDRHYKNSDENDNELGDEHAEPESRDGKYWKGEYDIYRANTQREVKKLITKQKAAKSFAQMKDDQCTELVDQLRQEQKRAEKLEARTLELASLVKELQAELRASQTTKEKHQEEIAGLKPQLGKADVANPSSIDEPTVHHESTFENEHQRTKSRGVVRRPSEPERSPPQAERHQEDPVQRPSEPYHLTTERQKPTFTAHGGRVHAKSKPDGPQPKPNDDIWAQLDSSTNPVVSHSVHLQRSTSGGLTVANGTNANPLKALSVNTLSGGSKRSSRGLPQSMDVECKSTPELERVDSKNSSRAEDEQQDSHMLPPTPPVHQEGHFTTTSLRSYQSMKHGDTESKYTATSTHLPTSSPLQLDAKALPSAPELSNVPATMDAKTSTMTTAKENISPSAKCRGLQQELHAKPSAMWSSMNAPPAGRRLGKDGKELSQDRIEAARARIAARGRVMS